VLARVTNNVMHWSQSAQSALLHCDFDTSTSEARITQSLKRLNVEMKRMAAAVQPKSFRAAMVAMQHLADAGDRSTVLSFIQSTISPHFRGEGDRQEGFWYVNNHQRTARASTLCLTQPFHHTCSKIALVARVVLFKLFQWLVLIFELFAIEFPTNFQRFSFMQFLTGVQLFSPIHHSFFYERIIIIIIIYYYYYYYLLLLLF
jgi:hypothetical protein